MSARGLPVGVLGLIIGLTVGCLIIEPNPAHCFHAQGDLTCAELDPERPYCVAPACSDVPYGCAEEPLEDGCYSPCGQDSLLEEDASCLEVSDESDTSSMTGTETGGGDGSDSETSDEECLSHEDCPEDDLPICLLGSCTGCDEVSEPDLACVDLTEGQAPVCLEGACVECTAEDPQLCVDAGLLCDLEAHVCMPCTAHDQCPGGAACDLVVGTCLPGGSVWHVDGDGGQDFETIDAALLAIGSGSGTVILHELDVPGYAEGLYVTGARTIALFAAEGERPLMNVGEGSIAAYDGARVYTRGLTLNSANAVQVMDSYAEFDEVRFAPQLGYTLRITNSTVRMNNSMLRSSLEQHPVIEVVEAGELDIRYSTILGLGDQAALRCMGAQLDPSSQVRNSILVNLGDAPAIECDSATFEGNGLEDAGFTDNTTIGDAQPDWFVDLLLTDLHLTIDAPIPISTAATWSEGDPLVDIDGDPRPAVEGSPDFAGADRLP